MSTPHSEVLAAEDTQPVVWISLRGGREREREKDIGAAALLAWTFVIRKKRQTLGSEVEIGRQTKKKREQSRHPPIPQD